MTHGPKSEEKAFSSFHGANKNLPFLVPRKIKKKSKLVQVCIPYQKKTVLLLFIHTWAFDNLPPSPAESREPERALSTHENIQPPTKSIAGANQKQSDKSCADFSTVGEETDKRGFDRSLPKIEV